MTSKLKKRYVEYMVENAEQNMFIWLFACIGIVVVIVTGIIHPSPETFIIWSYVPAVLAIRIMYYIYRKTVYHEVQKEILDRTDPRDFEKDKDQLREVFSFLFITSWIPFVNIVTILGILVTAVVLPVILFLLAGGFNLLLKEQEILEQKISPSGKESENT